MFIMQDVTMMEKQNIKFQKAKENYKYLQVIEGAIKGGFIGGALGTTVAFDTRGPAAPIVLIRGVIGLGIGSYFSLFSEEEK